MLFADGDFVSFVGLGFGLRFCGVLCLVLGCVFWIGIYGFLFGWIL